MAIRPELKEAVAPLQAQLEELTKTVKTKKNADKDKVLGTPFVRKGENIMGSRGYQFQRIIGLRTGLMNKEDAKVELEMHDRLYKCFVQDNGFTSASDHIIMNTGGTLLAPLGTELMGGNGVDDAFRYEVKSITRAGVGGADPDEIRAIVNKLYRGETKAQSWVDETTGGALVGPPEFGELIQLLRNKDALINAGARVIPMPSTGSIKYPRQTAASTGYWVGENLPITPSDVKTGSLLLRAKKCAALITMPSELLRFASPATEALLRSDMTKTLSLTFDKAALEGPGSDNVPLGILNTPGVATVTPTTVASDGNTISPQDVYKFLSAVEANNAEFQGWIMRPEMFYHLVTARGTTYSDSGGVGQFVFDQFRNLGTGFPKLLAGYPVTTTPQVSITRTKGNGTTLTYILGGQWDDAIMALFGTIEFAQATQGDNTFAQDQVMVRAILTGDFGLRHSGAFAVADTLIQGIGI